MSDFVLKLGDTAGFTVDDVPEKLPLGGDHVVAVKKFPGGRVQVQALGAFDREMAWEGVFLGPGAWDRAVAVGILRVSGKEILLQFGNILRYVMVKAYYPDYMNETYVPYSIVLQPTRKSGQVIAIGSNSVAANLQMPQSTISPSSDSATVNQNQVTHTITAGDTLWAIAADKYQDGTKWTKIAAANPGINPNNLQTGTTIIIPL